MPPLAREAAPAFTKQLPAGQPHGTLGRTIGISLLDFTILPHRPDLHSTYVMYDPAHAHRLTDLLELHFIELVKYRDDRPKALMTPLKKCLHILKFGEIYESGLQPLPRELEGEEGIGMAIERLHGAWANDELREWIEFREKARKDYASGLYNARNEGRAEGKAEGRAEGLRDAALRMLEKGMDQETVCQMLDLAPEDLP